MTVLFLTFTVRHIAVQCKRFNLYALKSSISVGSVAHRQLAGRRVGMLQWPHEHSDRRLAIPSRLPLSYRNYQSLHLALFSILRSATTPNGFVPAADDSATGGISMKFFLYQRQAAFLPTRRPQQSVLFVARGLGPYRCALAAPPVSCEQCVVAPLHDSCASPVQFHLRRRSM